MSQRIIKRETAKQLKLNSIWKQVYFDTVLKYAKQLEDTKFFELTKDDVLYGRPY